MPRRRCSTPPFSPSNRRRSVDRAGATGEYSAVTESEWVAEIVALRDDLGPLRPMRVTWRWKRPTNWARLSVSSILADTAHDDEELWVALFEHDADLGDESVVELRVEPREFIPTLAQGSDVPVAGRVAPGGAVALVTPIGVIWPLSPATVPFHRERLIDSRKGAAAVPPHRRQRTTRDRVRLASALLGVLWLLRVAPAAVTGNLTWSMFLVATAAYAAGSAMVMLVISAALRVRTGRSSATE
jgi:hypothetical protein